ncbi:hypothetical protein [Vampirovibrio chlorellavorus]|uniref:hypothetical protein n=1 Tax=Vampirovibrio chlorellavorus TaxID=758823 RepID=UPI0026EC67B9|nr:hypothetical protein [Vampirovibrio chlorellavorus]
MPDVDRNWLYLAHNRTGLLIKSGNRLLAAVLLLGGLFAFGCTGFLNFMQKPEHSLQLQGFLFNQAEFAQAEQGQAGLQGLRKSPVPKALDPNWDGAVAGASLGASAGQSIPMVGWIVGPLVGAAVGYHLDARI